jgi:hypothetical protein
MIGDVLLVQGDHEEALGEYRKAFGIGEIRAHHARSARSAATDGGMLFAVPRLYGAFLSTAFL